jgi:hypothetical protein
METSESIRISNNGNSTASFKWKFIFDKHFSITPKEGKIKSNGFIDCTIQY